MVVSGLAGDLPGAMRMVTVLSTPSVSASAPGTAWGTGKDQSCGPVAKKSAVTVSSSMSPMLFSWSHPACQCR